MGVIYDPVANLAAMFANCDGFSKWLGFPALDVAGATERIYIDGIGPADVDSDTMTAEQVATLRPCLVLYPDGNRGYEFTFQGWGCPKGNGSIIAVLSRNYDDRLSIDQHFRAASQLIEPVISSDNPSTPGLLEMTTVAGYLAFQKLSVVFVGRTPPEHRADYGDVYDVVFVFDY